MEKSLKLLSNRHRDIKNIFEDITINNKDNSTLMKDIYELDDNLYDFFKSPDVDEKFFDNFYNMIKSFLELDIIFKNNEDIKNFMLKSKNLNINFVSYFFDGLNLCKL